MPRVKVVSENKEAPERNVRNLDTGIKISSKDDFMMWVDAIEDFSKKIDTKKSDKALNANLSDLIKDVKKYPTKLYFKKLRSLANEHFKINYPNSESEKIGIVLKCLRMLDLYGNEFLA